MTLVSKSLDFYHPEMRKLLTFSLVLMLCLTGCGQDPAAKALAPLATATLMPGKGMGDLELGRTTLADVVSKYGNGLVSISYGDETMIEMTYLQNQISFGFMLCCQCATDTGGRLETGQDLKAFFEKHPSCRDLPLTSISVGLAGAEPSKAFYQGATDKGLKLGAPNADAVVHGQPHTVARGFVAGQSDRGSDPAIDGEGIVVYRAAPAVRITDVELQSGQRLPQERLDAIEKARKEALTGPVTRITIY